MKLRQLYRLSLPGLILMILAGCTAAAPRIEAVSWELFRIQSPRSGSVREELSLFVRAEDADGSSDLEELYLVHPESRLYWRIFSDTWEERRRNNVSWIGSSVFTGTDGVPRGEYLLVLLDRAGERAEERIYVDLSLPSTSASEDAFPKLVQQGGVFLIDSSAEGPFYIMGQDAEGEVLVSAETGPGSFTPGDYMQDIPGGNLDWYIFVYDKRGWYAGSGPY